MAFSIRSESKRRKVREQVQFQPFRGGRVDNVRVPVGDSGHYYCGLRVLTCPCCDGICGPQRGCNCGPCQKLDKEEAARLETESYKLNPYQPQLESWVWTSQPSKSKKKIFFVCLTRGQRCKFNSCHYHNR